MAPKCHVSCAHCGPISLVKLGSNHLVPPRDWLRVHVNVIGGHYVQQTQFLKELRSFTIRWDSWELRIDLKTSITPWTIQRSRIERAFRDRPASQSTCVRGSLDPWRLGQEERRVQMDSKCRPIRFRHRNQLIPLRFRPRDPRVCPAQSVAHVPLTRSRSLQKIEVYSID